MTLKGLLMQVKDFKKFLARSKTDGLVWAATFLVVIVVAIDIGLLVGIILSVLGLLYISLKPHVCILGRVSDTDLYLDIEKYEKASEIPSVKIFHFGGNINFATKASFKKRLLEKVKIDLMRELRKLDASKTDPEAVIKSAVSDLGFKHLIIDFSALSQIDSVSVSMLDTLIRDFYKLELNVSIAGCSTKIFESLMRNRFSFLNILFPTVHDAVISIK